MQLIEILIIFLIEIEEVIDDVMFEEIAEIRE